MRRCQLSRNAHRVGFGRVNQRLRRSAMGYSAPAPIGHNAMPESDNEPGWLQERPMSDEWNHNQPQTGFHPHDDNHANGGAFYGDQHQGNQPYVQAPAEFQPAHQHFEPAHEPHVTPVTAPETADHGRLDAIEAALAEIRGEIEALKSAVQAPAVEAAETPEAIAAVAEAPVPAADPHADRLASIETEIGHVKTLIGALAHTVATLHADVKSNADLHAETRAIVDEQHQLVRGLNYIITTAIGTLTAGAKQPK